jgi:hypothetical protein
MTTVENFDDLLEGGGPPAFKFDAVGATAKGVVVAAKKVQQTDIQSNKPEFWPSGEPKLQLVVTLKQDNGEETRVFCKPNARAAIQDAVKKSGGSFLAGGKLAIRYTGDEPSDKAGMSPKKLFAAQYEPPAAGASAVDDDLF